jgi:hypothetical protein
VPFLFRIDCSIGQGIAGVKHCSLLVLQQFYLICGMKKLLFLLSASFFALSSYAQDSTSEASDQPVESFDASAYGDADASNALCTQKVINQTPTRIISVGYEHNLKHDISGITANGLGGMRLGASVLAVSTNKVILSIGASYWGSKFNAPNIPVATSDTLKRLLNNRMDVFGFNGLMFKPLDAKHFIIAQANIDFSNIADNSTFGFDTDGMTYYASLMYGWKKNDYKMSAIGLARTLRLGRPLFVPIFLYNKTFNSQWGVEMLLPARAAVRYNFSNTNMLLAGFELEGQQYYMNGINTWLQRGEIKPRLTWEKKLTGFIWTSVQAGYRLGYRLNGVSKYNGKVVNEVMVNNWGNSPYFNVSFNFVTP